MTRIADDFTEIKRRMVELDKPAPVQHTNDPAEPFVNPWGNWGAYGAFLASDLFKDGEAGGNS